MMPATSASRWASICASRDFARSSLPTPPRRGGWLEEATLALVVLDIMMPGEDGLSLCRWLVGRGGPPVILLTAMADETDRIVGLELGADDYMVKPFNPRELLARIRAVLRRAPPVEPKMPVADAAPSPGWSHDPAARALVHAGRPDGRADLGRKPAAWGSSRPSARRPEP